jgi:hypothetical protein
MAAVDTREVDLGNLVHLLVCVVDLDVETFI